jgi:thiol-disulfide isomerase/thioredoxin
VLGKFVGKFLGAAPWADHATFLESQLMNASDSPLSPAVSRAKLGWVVLAAAVLAYLVYSVAGGRFRTGSEGPSHPAIGRTLPYLQLEPLTGDSRSVSLGDLQNRVTLVNFWGTWCPPCRREFPHIVELAAKFGGQNDFQLYAVSCGEGADEDLDALRGETRSFLEDAKTTLPTYADQSFATRKALMLVLESDGFAYPTTMIVDRQGTIRGLWIGYARGSEQAMERLVDQLLEERGKMAER